VNCSSYYVTLSSASIGAYLSSVGIVKTGHLVSILGNTEDRYSYRYPKDWLRFSYNCFLLYPLPLCKPVFLTST
jgi:hypothetical protein